MAKDKEEEKSDGLEIISVGSLYKGPWDKKYWSSSRGKDRYPYPVGYQAVRAHNGSQFKLEIHEGPKGPLFVITCDEQSCSGQTPDIAWEKFQKKGCSGKKIWHGKRFPCKIDGVEFFGFKNPFVQRLLRELVANVNGTAERSLLPSSFCNGASRTKHDSRCPDACVNSDLLPNSARPQITVKRSRKREIINTKSVSGDSIKRSRPQGLTYDAEISNIVQGNQSHNHGSFMPPSASKEEYDMHKHPGALPALMHLVSGPKDGLPSNSVDFSVHIREEAVIAEVRDLDGLENCKCATVANNLPAEEKPIDRSQDTEAEKFNFQNSTEDKIGDVHVPKDSPDANDVNLCAPDSLDLMQDNTFNSVPSTQDKSTYNVKEELTAADMVISQALMTGSHPGEEIGTYNSNAISEKSDFDSVGQEMVKSMMTFLLPQAVPLLKKVPRKKKTIVSPSKSLPCTVKSQEDNNETIYFVDVPPPALVLTENTHVEKEEKMHIQSSHLGSVVPSFEHTKSVILDSFEDHQSEDLVTNQVILSSDIAEADQASCDKDTCPPNTGGQLFGVDVRNESTVCHVETCGSKDIFCYNDVHMALNERPREGDVCMSESVLSCTSPSNKVFPEEIKDACADLDENPVGVGIHSEEKHLNHVPDCTEAIDRNEANLRGMMDSVKTSPKKIRAETVVAETGNTSVPNIPNVVYTRKKAQNVAPSARTYDVPLSESIIYRSLGDHCDPETDPATGTFLASEIRQMSSDNKTDKKDLNGVEARLRRQSHGLHTQKTTMNSKGLINNMSPSMSQNQALLFVPNDKDTSNSFELSVTHAENFQVHLDKKLLGHENLLKSSVSFQNQNISFFDNDKTSAKEVQASLDIKPQGNVELSSKLEGIVELVGCYVHPIPVSSLLLSTKGNEIYVCVLCGLLADMDRTLFMYKVAIKEPRVGCPSFIGHTLITLPTLKDFFGREIAAERSGLQFTPDGQYLVLLDSMKTPYCREGRIDCLCSTCTSDCFEENAVKILQVKFGYVSVVAKLTTVDSLLCILVCEPNHLVAVGESGRLHLWAMNSTWSAQAEEFTIPGNNCTSPGIIELKRIPKCATLVVGHNGFGEFSIWNISKCILLSRFSGPGTSIYQFFPISLFSWQRKGPVFSNSDVKEHVNGIMAATKMCFSQNSENNSFLPLEEEDIAIWLLVSTLSNSDDEHNYLSSDCQINSVGRWRLALLVKNMVILGSALDPSAAAIGALAGQGIIGTCDGLVYMWELSTGTKLGTLHHFKGGGVSCIATDDSRSGALAVAGDGGQLLVYLPSEKKSSN